MGDSLFQYLRVHTATTGSRVGLGGLGQRATGQTPRTPMPMVGKVVLESYEILEEIGRGGSGVVYRARCTLSQQVWAVKALTAQGYCSRKISHPGIVHPFGSNSEDRQILLSMEYVPGLDLQRLMHRRKRGLPAGQVIYLARQICSILDYLHGQDPALVFRDLKPSHVMVTDTGVVKLVDTLKVTRVGESSSFAGTPGYAAPDQVSDARTDLYALGKVLYFLLTGKDVVGPLSSLQGLGVHPSLEQLVRRACQDNPASRFQSTRQMARALQDCQGASPKDAALAEELGHMVRLPPIRRAQSAAVAWLRAWWQ